MRAVIITRPGGPEVLEIQDVEIPQPTGDQVRVRVHASRINRAALLQRAGGYPAHPGSPANITGLEFAGEVDAVGPLVRAWKPGQRVMGLAGGGAQAEYILSHEGLLVEIPQNLDFMQAAGIPEVLMTAHDALFTQAGLQIGERVHVVIDFIGAPYLDQNLQALAPWGRIVFLSTMGGAQANVNLGMLMGKRISMRGVTLRTRTLEEKLAVTRRFATGVLPLLANGKVKPVIDHVYPLEQIGEAHRVMGENRNFGKLVVKID